MNRIRQAISMMFVIALAAMGMTVAQAQQRPYRMSDRQVEQIIRRVETSADRFRQSVGASLDRGRLDGTRAEDDINRFIRDFESATDQLRSRFDSRASVDADVQTVLDRAASIEDFMQRNRLSVRAQNDWSLLKTDLNALANAYAVTWNWDTRISPSDTFPTMGSQRPNRRGDRQVEQIIRRVETGTDRFSASLNAALNRSRIDGTRQEDNITQFVRDFESATDQLRSRFDNRASVAADVETVLNRAALINDFMSRHRLNVRAQNDWSLLRTDLSALASAYNVAWNWDNQTTFPTATTGGVFGSDARLTGTYRLDPARSDNPRVVAERATRTIPLSDRQRIYNAVLARLESPERLAIERRGNTVTIASSRAPQTTFDADGSERTERLPNGVIARVRASLSGDQLTVSSAGYRENDFTATFESIDNGRRLRVTRRIFSDRLNQPVTVQNYYDRVAEVAQWDIYGDTQTTPTYTGMTSGDFIVPDGTTMVAVLNDDLTTARTQQGDRFTMTVREPAALYDGAIIEGTISRVDRGGRISGRSEMTLSFDQIRLRDGRSYRFAGFIDTVRTPNGETVRVDNEGTVEGSGSQTERTVQRAAIGTAVGAIIGAIAGGGKGAAIGAILGGGAGAGSVYVQGRNDLELTRGTEVTIRASAPR